MILPPNMILDLECRESYLKNSWDNFAVGPALPLQLVAWVPSASAEDQRAMMAKDASELLRVAD